MYHLTIAAPYDRTCKEKIDRMMARALHLLRSPTAASADRIYVGMTSRPRRTPVLARVREHQHRHEGIRGVAIVAEVSGEWLEALDDPPTRRDGQIVSHQQLATALEFRLRDYLWLEDPRWADKVVSDGDSRGAPGGGRASYVYIWWARDPKRCEECGLREEPCDMWCRSCVDLCCCGMEDCLGQADYERGCTVNVRKKNMGDTITGNPFMSIHEVPDLPVTVPTAATPAAPSPDPPPPPAAVPPPPPQPPPAEGHNNNGGS